MYIAQSIANYMPAVKKKTGLRAYLPIFKRKNKLSYNYSTHVNTNEKIIQFAIYSLSAVCFNFFTDC